MQRTVIFSFFLLCFLALLIIPDTLVGLTPSDVEKPAFTTKRQLRHVVLFKFKESATKADISRVERVFMDLPSKIPEIRDFEWGINNSPEGLDKGFTHCFFLTFDGEEDRAVYLPHPDHKAFGAVLQPHLEDVLVVDYWTGE